MKNFTYYSPTKIYFGLDEEKNIGTILKNENATKVLLVYGKNSIKKIGLYDTVVSKLKDEKIDFIELSGVEPNPKIDLCRIGKALCITHGVDYILGVGGGSVIDTCKNIACSVYIDEDPWKLNSHEVTPVKALPIGTILTISAAGSELSNSCVITNPETLVKNGFNFDGMRPKFAILNPKLSMSVSPFQTACGVVDILMHTLERYLNEVDDAHLSDAFALGLISTVLDAGKKVMENPQDYNARANLMLASSFSHNGLTGMGESMYFTVHKLEHIVSGLFDHVAHGAGLSVLYPAWASFVNDSLATRFATLARTCLNVEEDDDILAGKLGTQKLKEFFKSLNMPTTLSELGIGEDSFTHMASIITKENTTFVPGFVKLNYEDCLEIFKLAK